MNFKLFLIFAIVFSHLSFGQHAIDSAGVYIKGVVYIAQQNVVIRNMDLTLDHSVISGDGTIEMQSNRTQNLICRTTNDKRILISSPNAVHIETGNHVEIAIASISNQGKCNDFNEKKILSNPILINVISETAPNIKEKQYLFFKNAKFKPFKTSLINQQSVLDWDLNPKIDMIVIYFEIDTRKIISTPTNKFNNWVLPFDENPPKSIISRANFYKLHHFWC
ncbi:hypothetical protein FLBR109950_09490 [Flavobacterium branchiophilum]|uniref:Uncharacterized protein n=1 Tax=Flavobacterium branchiophilum (strain FL-15) TaxID=1034807 RepID=G2Z678_FLABF|nr:hypothetical protein [Flavobacterium branchiophilum]CCB70898.1 Protein of unknown function precursor [Flavobacterium branchiophilum FL-15]